jgi:hypothetical protein
MTMSKEFDAEIDAIVGARKAAADQAQQKVLDARAATARFVQSWDTCRKDIVQPTLSQIVQSLAQRQVRASVAALAGGAMALYVPYPEAPQLQGKAAAAQIHSHVQITPNTSTERVQFKHVDSTGASSSAGDSSNPVSEITTALIEQHALTLVRMVYGNNNN